MSDLNKSPPSNLDLSLTSSNLQDDPSAELVATKPHTTGAATENKSLSSKEAEEDETSEEEEDTTSEEEDEDDEDEDEEDSAELCYTGDLSYPVIGKGTYGTVVSLENGSVGKVLPLFYSGDFYANNLTELAVLGSVSHPGIVGFTEVRELSGGRIILVLPQWPMTLDKWVKATRFHERAAALPTIVRQLAEVLAYLHLQGINHGDLKPANIVIDPSTLKVALIDWGASCIRHRGRGFHMCSPHYAGPELVHGGRGFYKFWRSNRIFCLQNDVYSLWAVVYYLIYHFHPSTPEMPSSTDLYTVAYRSDLESIYLPPEFLSLWQEMCHVDTQRRISPFSIIERLGGAVPGILGPSRDSWILKTSADPPSYPETYRWYLQFRADILEKLLPPSCVTYPIVRYRSVPLMVWICDQYWATQGPVASVRGKVLEIFQAASYLACSLVYWDEYGEWAKHSPVAEIDAASSQRLSIQDTVLRISRTLSHRIHCRTFDTFVEDPPVWSVWRSVVLMPPETSIREQVQHYRASSGAVVR